MNRCKICGSDRCIGKYLLHPREMCFIPRIEEKHLQINPKRTFMVVPSPPDILFTRFKEVHVIAAPDEDVEIARNESVKIFVGDLVEKIMEGIRNEYS